MSTPFALVAPCFSVPVKEKELDRKPTFVHTNLNAGLYMWVLALSSCSLGLLNEFTGIDPLRGLAALKVSISFSPDIRNLSNDLSWNLHVCVIPSMSKYWGATDLKKNPDIFLCTARCLMALSAMLLFHGILSCSINVKRLCRYRLKRFWYLMVKSEIRMP